MKNSHTPDIRFAGFTGDWEQRKLGEITEELYNGQTPSRNNDAFWNGNINWLSSGELNRSIVKSTIEKITILGMENAHLKIVPKGTFVMAITGLEAVGTRGNCGILDIDTTLNQSCMAVFPNKKYLNTKFLFQWYRKNSELYGLKYTQGTKQQSYNAELVRKLEISLPNIEEQAKIGLFFENLDNLIDLHEQKLTTLKQTKQGFMQKMFPKEGESVPEVRFPGFTGTWKEHKLDSIVDRLKSYSLSRDVETNEYTGYKYIHYGDIHTKVADVIDESSNLPNIRAGNYELLQKGDLVLTDASEDYQGIATPAVITIDMPYKLVSGLHTIALRPKSEQVDSLFLYYLINSPIFKKYGYKAGTGMKVFGISVTNLLKFESVFPLFEEQAEIGNFFKKLDDTISLHQRELDALKETKKAFLQKMFV